VLALLEIEDLKTYYFTLRGPVKAVDGVTLELERGEVLGIAGESGCGKSTLAWSILGMVPPPGRIVSGRLVVDGIDVTKLSEEELRAKIRWKKVSMIFQGAMNSLNPVYTAGAQIEEVLTYHGRMSKLQARRRVYELLESVGLERSIAGRYPTS
jgi:ABC-type dipeptide/oligopeptide/nickel transport system, ATPase component